VSTGLHVKVVDIGDWNMLSTTDITVAHGLTLANIRAIAVTIRNDLDAAYFKMEYAGGSANNSLRIYADATNINLQRYSTSAFTSTNYDSTSYNRGWITIWHV